MRRYGKILGCTFLALALAGAPAAHADNASFVRDAKALGFQQDSDNLISMGESACYFFYEGERLRADPSRDNPPDRVAARIMRYGNVDLDMANRFLALSVNEYCPQYRSRIGA